MLLLKFVATLGYMLDLLWAQAFGLSKFIICLRIAPFKPILTCCFLSCHSQCALQYPLVTQIPRTDEPLHLILVYRELNVKGGHQAGAYSAVLSAF